MALHSNTVKALLCVMLVAICAMMLFIPVVSGAEEVRAMFLLLTGVAVRDYFGGVAQDKAVAAVKEAYDPAPPASFVNGEDA